VTVDEPWKKGTVLLIGGLTEIGFVKKTNNLLVVSHQGRGLIDCATGKRLARDTADDTRRWFDESRPATLGIGPAEGQWIEVCGLAGGQPAGQTADGWRAVRDADDVLLEGPSGSQRLSAENEELRAFGFSPDGHYFVLATPGDLSIYARR
jgi:hypothetical protein